MLCWIVFDELTTAFITVPEDISSSLLTGCAKRALMYLSRSVPEACRPTKRKQSYISYMSTIGWSLDFDPIIRNEIRVHTVKIYVKTNLTTKRYRMSMLCAPLVHWS